LNTIRELALRKGYVVHNVDVTVIMERPRLRPFIPAMIEAVAAALGIPVSDVSIKAKTNEGMGFIGRNEGVAAIAVVTVNKG
ncbi:MAG: 2-C-methyl-D-erythritol 2,4-cyclodiphosphate synthase, partial [Syntrophales bacterium]|nr:2-C-methyl-D-erythritol 2,4-cyclodiphosphate synthase [Syntrophales bacterium]